MKAHVGKAKDNMNQSVSAGVRSGSGGPFVDNRPEAGVQLQRQAMADSYSERSELTVPRPNNNTGLPDRLKSGMENMTGFSLEHVNVHYNSDKPAKVHAHAFAQGGDIHLAPGQSQHLPHELGHVVQQMKGLVRPTTSVEGMSVNDDAGLENTATAMGRKALQMSSTGMTTEGDSNETQQNEAPSTTNKGVKQMASFLYVKRIENDGSLYTGKNTAGPPDLDHAGGTNWYGPKVTAAEYAVAPGGLWRIQAKNPLNLIDMGTADSVKWIMQETARRRGIQGLSPDLLQALGNFDFAYAIPNAVATVADDYLQYAQNSFAGQNPVWPGNNYGVDQAQMDLMVQFSEDLANISLTAGSVIQTFAGHDSGHAVQLDDPVFLANPEVYRIIRKDATNLDAGFANALIADLNEMNLFHGLHVPLGMKFGGWTGTKLEALIWDCPNNLTVGAQVLPNGNEPDINIQDKMIGVDDSLLARAWRFFGMNG